MSKQEQSQQDIDQQLSADEIDLNALHAKPASEFTDKDRERFRATTAIRSGYTER